MLITLEHNGTEEHTKASNILMDYLEDMGHSVQIVSGHYDKEIYGYDENGKRILSISVPIDETYYDTINYILGMLDQ